MDFPLLFRKVIYFWLCCIFIAVWTFLSWWAGATLQLQCLGFSLQRFLSFWSISALRCTVSVVSAPRLYSTGAVVVAHGFIPVKEKFNQEATVCGISPDQGVEPMSPTLAGGFFIIAPPGKPLPLLFIDHISILTSKTFFILRRFLSHYLFKFVVCLNLNILWKPTFPGSSSGTESVCSAGDPGSIPGSGRSSGEGIGYPLQYSWASLVAQTVKNTPAVCETWVWSLGWEYALAEGVFLPGESPWTEEPGGW